MSTDPIYVIGHRNPDTDAICSAIGYAAFLRDVRGMDAEAACCGEVSVRTNAWPGPGSGTGTEVTSSGAPKAVATAACMSAMTCSSLTGAGSHLSGRGARPDPGRRYEDEIGPKRAVVPG